MPVNHLEQLVAEWLEYRGYFVRRNLKVGRRPKGGYDCEIDILGFHPETKHFVQYEPSTDSSSWAIREKRYTKKFEAGRRHAHSFFKGLPVPEKLDQYAVFLLGSPVTHNELAGGKVIHASVLLAEMTGCLRARKIKTAIVPEQFALLRVLQLACEFERTLFPEGSH